MKNEDFRIGSFSFDIDENETPLSHLEKHNFYGEPKAERFVRFLKDIGITYFDTKRRCEIENENACALRLMRYCNPLEEGSIGWDCHQASSYMVLRETEKNLRWKRLFLGFVSQRFPNDTSIHCGLHSWVADKDLFFVDPRYQANCDDEAHTIQDMKRRGRWLDLKRPRVILDDFFDYHGVEIPFPVVSETFEEVPDEHYGNLWRHLNRQIFSSDNMTNWFTNVVKHNGAGWIYIPEKAVTPA